MMRRLQSLQEHCRSRPPLPERPFYNIGRTAEQDSSVPTPVANDPESSFQPNFVDVVLPHISTPKPNSSVLPSNCADVAGQGDQDLPSVTEKSAKRLHSDINSVGTVPVVDREASLSSLSPVRKRSRQDTDASVLSESIATAAVGAGDTSEKSPAVINSPAEKSVDSMSVELGSSAACEPCTASSASAAAFVFGRSGSCSSLNRPTSVVRSGNSSPRTWPSRRDLGQVVFSHMFIDL